MACLYLDAALPDDARRHALYRGDLFLYSARPATRALVAFARGLLEEAFRPFVPEEAQHHLPVRRYAEILALLKPAFIHHPESKRHLQAILADLGCDPDATHFDVPRLRSSTSGGYLTTGIAYAFHPHRDTWYSAPMCQLNWWLPLHPLGPDDGLAFHPRYWSRPVKNGSRHYDYTEWNRTSRFDAAKHVGVDTRVQPRPEEELELADDLRIVCGTGDLVLFSAAQLHSSVENRSGRTRFSIDFRTVHLDEVRSGGGAPNLDSECTGTTMRDYLRLRDLARLPEEWIARYEDGYGR